MTQLIHPQPQPLALSALSSPKELLQQEAFQPLCALMRSRPVRSGDPGAREAAIAQVAQGVLDLTGVRVLDDFDEQTASPSQRLAHADLLVVLQIFADCLTALSLFSTDVEHQHATPRMEGVWEAAVLRWRRHF